VTTPSSTALPDRAALSDAPSASSTGPSSTQDASHASAAPSVVTHRPFIVAAILLAMFMAAMEATVVATAMPTVVADLSGLDLYGWVGSIYMLATTVTIPLWGKLADLSGRRNVMLAGLFVFLVGSVGSGMSPTMTSLIVFRAIQGVGAGALQPTAMTIIGDIFTIQERAKMQGVFGAVWGIAGITGPLLGGLIVKVLTWRWVFYINVPFGVLSAVFLVRYFHERDRPKGQKTSLDVLGAITLTACVLSVLGAAGGTRVAVFAPLSLVTLGLFLFVERRAKEPILPLSLFRSRVISVSSAVSFLLGAIMMATLMYTPFYVQAVRGGSATDGGTAVAPMLIGWPLASAFAARLLVKMGFRPLVRLGLLLLLVSGVALAWAVRAEAPLNVFRVTMFVMGGGMGLTTMTMLVSVQDAVDWKQRGVATASSMFFRTIGGALIVGALGAVLSRGLSDVIPEEVLRKMLTVRGEGNAEVQAAFSRYAHDIAPPMAPLFTTIAVLALLALAIGLAFPDVKVKSRAQSAAPPVHTE
jgi:EmrB/QacA subfamily drug resistance transporter